MIALLVSPTASSESKAAVDLGTIGRLYPIGETNLLQDIRKRLAVLERSGRLAAWAQQAFTRARARAAAPPGVTLPAVTVPALRESVLKPPAMRIFKRRLLFIDGTSEAQLNHAQLQLERYREDLKLVLVFGSPLLLRQQGLPAYFDQYGSLAGRIGVKRVPSMVYARDGKLLIEELRVDE